MRLLVPLLSLFLLMAVPVQAGKCPPKCKHRTHAKTTPAVPEKPAPAKQTAKCEPCPKPAPVPAVVVTEKHEAADWKSGFELVTGFRWDREIECPTQPGLQSTSHQADPFYLGLQERLPLNEYFTLQGRIDRDISDHGDFLESSHWNGAVSLNWAPWR